jgi:hypothetical protein
VKVSHVVQSTPPKALSVDAIAVEPTLTDQASLAHISARDGRTLEPMAYVVRVRLEAIPPATAAAWALYVGDLRVPKYWAAEDGIFFKVTDPRFIAENEGKPLRFSRDGVVFTDTGLTLPKLPAAPGAGLPSESETLK